MTGLDDVRQRLGDDPGFELAVAGDPRAALAGYQLTVDELTVVAQLVEAATARLDPDDQRRSHAGFFALLAVASAARRSPAADGTPRGRAPR